MTYVDRTLNCVDCGVEFIHSAADQEYYVQKGFSSDPKRCTSCRASRRAARDGGFDVRDIGGPRGYERGDDRPNREYFAVVCSSCGNQAQVPFKPPPAFQPAGEPSDSGSPVPFGTLHVPDRYRKAGSGVSWNAAGSKAPVRPRSGTCPRLGTSRGGAHARP